MVSAQEKQSLQAQRSQGQRSMLVTAWPGPAPCMPQVAEFSQVIPVLGGLMVSLKGLLGC